jgi:deaminated glutathione amidase
MDRLVAAVVQLSSTEDVARNLDRSYELVVRAAHRGAGFVALPENFAFLSESEAAPPAEELSRPGPILRFGQKAARELKIHLLLGSLPEQREGDARIYNTSVLFGPEGQVVASYRKIHLFDVLVGGKTYQESLRVAPGEAPVLAETAFGKLGLSICYDLRFPELYRALSQRGATMLSVPAAFTLMTGKDHWEVLLRARAIENQCFVLAPAQTGKHGAWRMSYGHSLIVDPWGIVMACAPEGEGLALAELDFSAQERVRQDLPALRHRVL